MGARRLHEAAPPGELSFAGSQAHNGVRYPDYLRPGTAALDERSAP